MLASINKRQMNRVILIEIMSGNIVKPGDKRNQIRIIDDFARSLRGNPGFK